MDHATRRYIALEGPDGYEECYRAHWGGEDLGADDEWAGGA